MMTELNYVLVDMCDLLFSAIQNLRLFKFRNTSGKLFEEVIKFLDVEKNKFGRVMRTLVYVHGTCLVRIGKSTEKKLSNRGNDFPSVIYMTTKFKNDVAINFCHYKLEVQP